MIHATIKVYTHNFSVEPISSDFNRALIKYAKEFYYEQLFYNKRGEVISDNSRIFAAATKTERYTVFITMLFLSLLIFLNGIIIDRLSMKLNTIIILHMELVNFPFPNVSAREYQIPVIDYIASDKLTKFKLLALNTGEGKTISAFFGMQRLKLKTSGGAKIWLYREMER
jgi:hypothetical protein